MTDLLTILLALVIIASLVGFFGFLAWKINMPDPLNDDETSNSNSEKNKKKEKNSTEQGKKKQQQQQQRKDQKKSKRETKDEEQQQQQKSTKGKPKEQTSEETDDDREESEQEILNVQPQVVETSSKARKRNKNKARASTPPPPPSSSSTRTETDKSSNSTRVPSVTHLKSTSKDELESSKTQSKTQTKSTTKKVSTQSVEKHEEEQPFTVVGGNRHKNTTSASQQQQNKPQVTPAAPVQHVTVAPVHPVTVVPVQPEPQRPKESVPVKQAATQKVADLIKILPSSQAAVTELMSALDAFPLATNDLDIIMHKIENKQWLLNKDWSKPKVDSQVRDESVKDDLKNNSVQRIKELTEQLNNEKRRNHELLKEQTDKNQEIQILHAQLDKTESNPNQSKVQNLELQLKRVTEENRQLSSIPTNNNSSNVQVQVLSEQIKKLSVDNANWEKKAHSNELLAREAQNEKEDLIRNNEQLTEALQNAEKNLQHIEEKHHRQVNENRTSHFNEINEFKQRVEQLQTENEQLRREDIVHVEPSSADADLQTITVNTEERERLEKDIEQLKQIIDDNQRKFHEDLENLRNERRTQENEIERLKQDKAHAEHRTNESHQVELNALRAELKSTSEAHQRQVLTDLLSEDLRHQLPHDTSDFTQWLSSYRQLSESNKRHLHEETTELKHDKERLQKNMHEIEKQLKDIETTLQNKEESLLVELKSKDATIENLHHENEQINGELGNLRVEIQRLQTAHDASINETRALKHQLDERILVANNTPSVVDESFELVKQPTPSLSPIVIDIRAEHLNPHETITHETSTSDHPQ